VVVAVVMGPVVCLRSVDGTKRQQLRVANVLRAAGQTKHAGRYSTPDFCGLHSIIAVLVQQVLCNMPGQIRCWERLT
jgi:hypothetical protein